MVWLFHRVIFLGFVFDENDSSDGMTDGSHV